MLGVFSGVPNEWFTIRALLQQPRPSVIPEHVSVACNTSIDLYRDTSRIWNTLAPRRAAVRLLRELSYLVGASLRYPMLSRCRLARVRVLVRLRRAVARETPADDERPEPMRGLADERLIDVAVHDELPRLRRSLTYTGNFFLRR
jgi:hypothetical protein